MPEDSQSEREYLAAQERLFTTIAAGEGRSSVVPMRASYVNAAQCLSILTFPPFALAQQICDQLIPMFAAIDPHHHYYTAPTLHLTIKGIRAAASPAGFSDHEARAAGEVLRCVAPHLPRLEFVLRGIAHFPTGLVVRAFGTTAFRDAVRMLDHALREANIECNKVYASPDVFIGNLTFCRFTTAPSAQLLDSVCLYEAASVSRFVVDTVHLVSCDEVCSLESRRSYVAVPAGE